MARGAESKSIATQTILNSFPGSFVYDKEIRIPFVENGEEIQLKCVLTCAKTNVEENGENAIPGETSGEINFGASNIQSQSEVKHIETTEAEKENIRNLMNALGL